MIADCFGPERINEYLGKHKLDLVLVYGAEPWSLSECGRSNARFVSKATFEALSLPDNDGRFFIVSLFDIKPLIKCSSQLSSENLSHPDSFLLSFPHLSFLSCSS